MKKGMGKKKKIIALSVAALLLLIAAVSGISLYYVQRNSPAETEEEEEEDNRVYISKTGYTNLSEEEQNQKGNYTSAQERIADMQLVAEDEYLRLYLDPDFAEFAVEDKESGECWFSNPYDFATDAKAGSDTANLLQSLVTLTYYDASSTEGTMNSYADCTSKDQYTIEQLENGFAIHMQIGRVQESMLLPYTIEASKFEELILPYVSERDARRLNSYYTKVSMSDSSLSDSVKNSYLASAPGLADNDFYILRSVVDREKRLIEEILLETEYTEEDMEEDLELSGYESEETSAALFLMSLYVELEDGDLKVTVPSSSISYDTTQYYLASFQLLNYFGAGTYSQDGYLFVPDGSGALINYNNYGLKKTLYTTNSVYGTDYTLSFNYELNSLSTQIYFPVYGNKQEEKAFLAIIEDGEAMANIISESGNIISSYETVYAQFYYETAYTVNYTDSTKVKGLYTYHDTNSYTGNYCIRYRFLTGENADYVGMAESYQSYLVDEGILEKLSDGTASFYIEALGAVERTNTKMGIPYVESVALTTFAQAEEILSSLMEAADVDLKLRYKGWANGGLYYSVFNKANVESSLGGKSGLAALADFASENGIAFFPEVDFFMVGKDTLLDGYSSSTNGVRSIQREIQYLASPQQMTTTSVTSEMWLFYSVSPYYYLQYMESFFSDYDKLELDGISAGNVGTMLYAEYQKKKAMNRQEAMETIEEGLETYFDQDNVMFDGGNAYTLSYATDLLNVPMSDSSYTLEDESVPFMQLVLHGYVHYAGEAINLTGDYTEMFLRSIEYGSSPFFTVAADNVDVLKKTMFTYYYSVDWQELAEEIKDCAAEWAEAYNGLENQAMVDHEKVSEDVYRTEYEDGTVFYVNYGDTEAELSDGLIVEARSYLKVAAQ